MTSVLADTIPGIRVVKAFAQEQREIERFRPATTTSCTPTTGSTRPGRSSARWSSCSRSSGCLIVWAFGAWQSLPRLASTSASSIGFQLYHRPLLRPARVDEPDGPGHPAGGDERAAPLRDPRPRAERRRAGAPGPPRPAQGRDRVPRRRVPAREPDDPRRHQPEDPARRDDRRWSVPAGRARARWSTWSAGSTTSATGRSWSTATISARSRWPNTAAISASCCRSRSCSSARSPRTSPTAGPTPRREEIIAAARAARAHEFILRLADGYDSLVGERGQSLSGGERQRISIARALLIDPTILILDEATSSVDTETEREIQEALDNLIRGRTTIAIAHRLSTLRQADRLVVLERGRIAEVGHQDDLLKSPGAYARLHKAQAELAAGTAH